MKKFIAIILALSCFFSVSAQGNKYGLKSGIAKTTSTFQGHVTYGVLYFDNYGKMESLKQQIEVPGIISYDIYTVTKGEDAWMVTDKDNKKSFKKFDNPTYDLNLLNPSEEVKAKYNLQYLGTEKYLGRTCKKYSYDIKQGGKIAKWTVLTYKGVVLRSHVRHGKKETIVETTEFKENVSVPKNVFQTSN